MKNSGAELILTCCALGNALLGARRIADGWAPGGRLRTRHGRYNMPDWQDVKNRCVQQGIPEIVAGTSPCRALFDQVI